MPVRLNFCVLLLALVWQLMKAYTLSILTKLAGQTAGHAIVEREIVAWANQKVCKLHDILSYWFTL